MQANTPSADLPNGALDHCQICGAQDLEQIIDLGHQPPCDSLLTPAQLREPEAVYPLTLVRCTECGLVQIDYVVPRETLFHPDYPYRSGITPTLARNLHGTGIRLVEKYRLPKGGLAIDIGSNDGTLLTGFRDAGMRVLGVEATNIARLANEAGIETIQAFFGEDIARDIVRSHGRAAIVTAANMFAHVPNLGDLLRGVAALLEDGGVFVTESHYLLDLLETVQYDSVYHEHLKYYALRPLKRLFDGHGFTVVDADRIPNYGGSIRIHAEKGRNRPVSDRLAAMEDDEERAGLYDLACFRRFAERIRQSKLDLQAMLLKLRQEGRPAPGIGCPGRCSTLLNYCNIDRDLMPYIAEQSSSLKLGLHLPGKHIPVVDERRLFDEQPDYAVMLSWHYATPIIAKLRERGLRSKIIVPLPDVHVADA